MSTLGLSLAFVAPTFYQPKDSDCCATATLTLSLAACEQAFETRKL